MSLLSTRDLLCKNNSQAEQRIMKICYFIKSKAFVSRGVHGPRMSDCGLHRRSKVKLQTAPHREKIQNRTAPDRTKPSLKHLRPQTAPSYCKQPCSRVGLITSFTAWAPCEASAVILRVSPCKNCAQLTA